jgi:isopropylmalate/homocitrate/citramalate synthase
MTDKDLKEKIFVSNYLKEKEVIDKIKLPEKILIYDTTLRDGEQTPGVSFSKDQKLEISHLLDEIGIPQIEAGFPVVSKEEAQAVKAITKEGLDAEILVLTRLRKPEVDIALDCDVDMVLLFIAASELHRKYKLKRSCEELEDCIIDVVEYSRAHGLKTSFSTEDTTRAQWDIIERYNNAAVESGADRLGITDTVGCIHPEALEYLVNKVKSKYPVPVSIHLHNDFGLATANAISGVTAGAQAVATTVNGIGERAGNVPLIEFIMAMETLYGYEFGLDTARFKELSDLVSKHSGIPVPVNQPLVGKNIFTHESGIHVAAVLNNPATYECIPPEIVGNCRNLILGKHTGTHVIEKKLSERGISADSKEIDKILEGVKNLGGVNGSVTDSDFWKIVNTILNR